MLIKTELPYKTTEVILTSLELWVASVVGIPCYRPIRNADLSTQEQEFYKFDLKE